MRIGVCDDEPLFLDMLREKLEGYYRSLDLRIDGFSSGEALVRAVEKDPFSWSLVFLDIEMPGMSGLEAARAVRDVNDTIPVILLTSHTEYAMKGYEVEAFRFLAKPVEESSLFGALRAVEERERRNKRIQVKADGRELFIPLVEILYFRSENVYLTLYMTGGRHCLLRKKLKEQAEGLPPLDFFQIHRSYLVGLRHVSAFDGREVTLSDGTRLPVSRGKRAAFVQALSRYISEKE